MYAMHDTIAAIATAQGESGIAVLRLSGPDSVRIAQSHLDIGGRELAQHSSPAVIHGRFRAEGELLDEVLVILMRAPRSYTGEDVVEIQCHGSPVITRRILRALISAGARSADPGEFTLRAFMNGRMDLVQAEAVADLIHAQTARAASVAIDQLQGSLSTELSSIYSGMMELVAMIEVGLDFSEEDIELIPVAEVERRLEAISCEIAGLMASYDEGRILRNGARVVISGRPNVGKSTLLNRLLDSERAIVSHIPGTTRDSIEERISIDGFPVILTDTAGLRRTDCAIEEEGIRRTLRHMEAADMHIYIIDSTIGISEEDREYLQRHDPDQTILVYNKIDLAQGTDPARRTDLSTNPMGTDLAPDDMGTDPDGSIVPAKGTDPAGMGTGMGTDLTAGVRGTDPTVCRWQVIEASLINGIGVQEIRDAIRSRLERGIEISDAPHSTISERHYAALKASELEISACRQMLDSAYEGWETAAASSLRDAAERIGEILGRSYHADLLENIFSKFCIGK